MWQKRSEKRSKNMTKPAKAKLFKNPIKAVETTVISAGSKLEGRIEAEGSLIIDGSLRGTIKCGALEIMEDGYVDASVEAEAVNVAGNFEGEMICRGRLTFFRTGKVKGDISYKTLSIEAGGLLDGNVSKSK
jgi:cytoskeletal protein CcmA (bactofilin family)